MGQSGAATYHGQKMRRIKGEGERERGGEISQAGREAQKHAQRKKNKRKERKHALLLSMYVTLEKYC